ncbi:MarR family transcriptional regulator [Xinfangfangia sp. D13-10-4-6]|uniref:MarR family winged helix-turn-helix transcriptional regulator n=1 Tax=Pseudogemmobacter hezensis TaxID=2737662 RepID=UPI0015544347|nr:MarR family transcriptional regulator [Pseudogemmobacter hezensis]NPD17156.1 MarR family transcriptional regulator [Pseudogemmobacter hezensis]
MESSDNFSTCLVLNTVSAARILLRRYDQRLKIHGVTVQQFALLSAIRFHPSSPVASFAQKVALDRTSLTRSLDLLERKGLVRRLSGSGNARLCALSEIGDRLLDTLRGEWQAAQSELLSRVSAEEAATYLQVARALSEE